jgi:hypothetical protein
VVGTDGAEKDEAFTFEGAAHSELDVAPSDIQDSHIKVGDIQDTVTTPVAPDEK